MQTTLPVATKSRVSVTIGIIIGVMVAAGITSTAWGFLKYSKTAEAYILQSFLTLGEVKTMAYDGSIAASAEVNEGGNLLSAVMHKDQKLVKAATTDTKYALTVSFAGETDLRDEKNPASSLDLGVKYQQNTDPAQEFKLNLINKDQSYYVRVPTLPSGDEYAPYAEFVNKWIQLDYSSFAEDLTALTEEYQEELDANPEAKKNREKIMESLKRTVALNPPIKVTKTFRNEKIAGNEIRHYTFTLNPKNIEKIMKELAKKPDETGVYPRDIDEMKQVLAEISNFKGEIWMDKTHNYPYKLTLSLGVKEADGLENGKLSLSLNMKNFNRHVNIQKPIGAISFEEVMNKVLEQYQNDYSYDYDYDYDYDYSDDMIEPKKLNDADGDTLTDDKEKMFGTDPKKKDTDGDGYDDAQEILSGHNPLGR